MYVFFNKKIGVNMRNNKGFTLVELLAVIIILGLLMVIATPSITKYISNARVKTYLRTLDSFAYGISKMIANDELPSMNEEDTTYYIPFECIDIDKGGKSPSGEWDFAYVAVTNTDNQRQYHFYTKDIKQMSVDGIENSKLKSSDVRVRDITNESLPALNGTRKTHVVPNTCDYTSAVVSETAFKPEDSCFELDSNGNIIKWNVSGTLTTANEYIDFIPDKNDTCYSKNLIIPNTINNQTVKGILVSNTGSISDIQKTVFAMKGLESVTLPKGLETLGESAFTNN